MTKQELIDGIQMKLDANLSKKEIGEVLAALATVAAEALAEGGGMDIPGVARLKTKDRAQRPGRNPQTGAAITIPARRVIQATPVKALRDAAGF